MTCYLLGVSICSAFGFGEVDRGIQDGLRWYRMVYEEKSINFAIILGTRLEWVSVNNASILDQRG